MSCDLEVTNENGAGKYLDSWETKLTVSHGPSLKVICNVNILKNL